MWCARSGSKAYVFVPALVLALPADPRKCMVCTMLCVVACGTCMCIRACWVYVCVNVCANFVRVRVRVRVCVCVVCVRVRVCAHALV
jgi:hypothetical protein